MPDQTCRDRARAERLDDAPCARAPAALAPAPLANAVLRAIVAMASESRRREAEAVLAARRAGLTATRAEIRHAVDMLLHARQLANPVELADGGIIVSLPDPAPGQGRRPRR